MTNQAVSIICILYGIFGLCFAVTAWPIMRERDRVRQKRYDAYTEITRKYLASGLRDLREENPTHPFFRQ